MDPKIKSLNGLNEHTELTKLIQEHDEDVQWVQYDHLKGLRKSNKMTEVLSRLCREFRYSSKSKIETSKKYLPNFYHHPFFSNFQSLGNH